MFRFAENSRCRENEIPTFAGMEGGGSGEIKSIPIPAPHPHSRPSPPFPRKRESPRISNCLLTSRSKTVRGWGDSRFRGNGNSFFDKKRILTLRRLRGGCEREAVAGGGEMTMMDGIPPPPKNSLARIFTPPRKRRRVRQSAISLIPAFDFHSCPLFHSCVGRNLCGEAAFADRRQLQCSASRKILAVARMRFRLSPEWKEGGRASSGVGGHFGAGE